MKKPGNVAIVYDRLNSFGGAERVLQLLHEMFPDAHLYSSVYKKNTPWIKDWNYIHTSFLQRIGLARTRHQLFAPLMPLAFETFDFSQYSLVISVTSEAAKGVLTGIHTTHICYLLTPTRYLWSHVDEYRNDYFSGIKSLFLPAYYFFLRYLRWWDKVAATRPDVIIPISDVVKKRAIEYYKRKDIEEPIYPPVHYAFWSIPSSKPKELPDSYFLCVSRLVPYKKIDWAIQAANTAKKHLVVVGIGEELKKLKNMSSQYIHFFEKLDEEMLRSFYQHAEATVCPGIDDFGLTALESMAAGRPAIVNKQSGNAEVVVDRSTGLCVELTDSDDLVYAFRLVENMQWDKKVIQRQAQKYSEEKFKKGWEKYL